MRGKSKSPRSSRRKEARIKTGKSQNLVTSAATIIKEDAPPYHAAVERAPSPGGEGRGEGGRLRFIDLFCGIGGFRLAFERAGGQCVFSSDWNEQAQITYEANHGERPHGDIHTVAVADIPAHDILCAGFPCQPLGRTEARRQSTREIYAHGHFWKYLPAYAAKLRSPKQAPGFPKLSRN